MSEDVNAILGIDEPAAAAAAPARAGDTTHPLYGVHGWLKFGVVVNLYLAPVVFVLYQLATWYQYSMASGRYPLIVLLGMYGTFGGGFLIARGMIIARGFRDLQPRSVQRAKSLLWLNAVFVAVSIPLALGVGLPPAAVMPSIVKGVVQTALSFAVIYTYLSVSKRVAVTFPDWKEE